MISCDFFRVNLSVFYSVDLTNIKDPGGIPQTQVPSGPDCFFSISRDINASNFEIELCCGIYKHFKCLFAIPSSTYIYDLNNYVN